MTLAPFACQPDASRGRLFPEKLSTFRSPFQRDRDRILHTKAFRRLKHKTQVFVEHEGDYYRTRLTHTIEVAQVARTIAGTLGLNVELAEAVALAHDLGHPPFGHTGEDALAELMQPYGGFDHNAQAIRIVTDLERMADHAAGNARIVIDIAGEPLLKPLVDIPRMAAIAREMLNDSITAYIEQDAQAARACAERDDEVDALYNQIYRELLTYMMADPGTINRATHLLWVAHNLERIGDRATNICERVVFAETGELTEINVSTY